MLHLLMISKKSILKSITRLSKRLKVLDDAGIKDITLEMVNSYVDKRDAKLIKMLIEDADNIKER